MRLAQRKLLTSTEFEFLPDRLNYTFRNLSGSKQISVDYADVSFDPRRITERYSSYLYVGLVLFGVGALLGVFIYSTEERISGFNYAVIGLIFLVAYFVQRKEYALLSAGNDVLVILGDKQSKPILDEIDRLRKTRFLEILRRPDFLEDEVKRRGLIAWLVERRVISDHEADDLLKGPEHEEPPRSDEKKQLH